MLFQGCYKKGCPHKRSSPKNTLTLSRSCAAAGARSSCTSASRFSGARSVSAWRGGHLHRGGGPHQLVCMVMAGKNAIQTYDICLNIMIKHESKTICESDQHTGCLYGVNFMIYRRISNSAIGKTCGNIVVTWPLASPCSVLRLVLTGPSAASPHGGSTLGGGAVHGVHVVLGHIYQQYYT